MQNIKEQIHAGNTYLGIEFGSTRIKAVLMGEDYQVLATGEHSWENQLEQGIWTYSQDMIWDGLKDCYKDLKHKVQEQYGEKLTTFAAIGFSAMMHGYMAFDQAGELLVPFRTWRNSITGEAAEALTEAFAFNIPERWSIAHLYQAILNREEHVERIDFFTTLAGYIHWKLTGEKVLGVGDASGMFPIDSETGDYDKEMLQKFQSMIQDKNYSWKIQNILPSVRIAGQECGALTEQGAKLLDPEGDLQPGIALCPPEGDAGTGMVATNSVAKHTGNVSAGTSVFAMVVLEQALQEVHKEIDMVTTPDGSAVGMVHANNCTSDLNAWVGLFAEFAETFGINISPDDLYGKLYNKAMTGDADCGGLLSYGYLSGENITGVSEGRPMFVRSPESDFNLANFMRSHLYTSLGALKVGMDILLQEEEVFIDRILGHGGLFKTKGVGQQILADAINAPVSVMETAGEGGPWGMAILAAYMIQGQGSPLETYLAEKVFKDAKGETLQPVPENVQGYEKFTRRYVEGIKIEQAALEHLI